VEPCLAFSMFTLQNQNQIYSPGQYTVMPVATCSFAPPVAAGAVSSRVSATAPVRPACAGLSLGRLAPVTLTCLLVATSLERRRRATAAVDSFPPLSDGGAAFSGENDRNRSLAR
jgi:hypothetical protein